MIRFFVIAVAVPIYAALYLVTACGAFAWSDARADRYQINDYRTCRENAGFALGWSLLPPALVIAPFITGGYLDGLRWPDCSRFAPSNVGRPR